jgi:hypothetical protein
MAKGKAAAKKAPRAASKSVLTLDVDYSEFPDTAKGRAMARQAARIKRDEKVAAKGEDVTLMPEDFEQPTA